MKSAILISIMAYIFLSSCMLKKASTFNDDVYANPAADRIEEARLAAIEKKRNEEIVKRYNDSIATVNLIQKQKDDANPYYKDSEFKYDDYYDYEYATRVKRFDNSIKGLSYYDNYYTNSYWYNQNPYNYGVSVYNGYSWWGTSYNNYSYNPSVNFYNNNGWGNNFNNGYNGYNPYLNNYNNGFNMGYNAGFNNGFNGMPYGYGNSFGYGYNSGFGNPYGNQFGFNNWNNNYGNSNGWGYYNNHDYNSSYTYGPRSSHGGSNSRQSTNQGMRSTDDTYYNNFRNAAVVKQNEAVKFEPIERIKQKETISYPKKNINSTYQGVDANNPNRNIETQEKKPVRTLNDRYDQPIKVDTYEQPTRLNTKPNVEIKTQEPLRQQPSRNIIEKPNFEQPIRQLETPRYNERPSQSTSPNGSRPR